MNHTEARLTIRHVLLIGPSNVGDAVLTLPLVAACVQHFPKAQMTVMGGARARRVFASDARIATFVEYGSDTQTWHDRWQCVRMLRRQYYDLVLDVRHTLLPWALRGRWRTNPLTQPPTTCVHRRDRYQWYAQHILQRMRVTAMPSPTPAATWALTAQEQQQAAVWLPSAPPPIIAVSAGARSEYKRWPAERFAQLCDRLIDRTQARIVLTGEEAERSLIAQVEQQMRHAPLNIVGETTVRTLAAVLARCQLVITNDSAALHIASTIGTSTIALFGPTDPAKYGPRSPHSAVLHRPLIADIPLDDVFVAVTWAWQQRTAAYADATA